MALNIRHAAAHKAAPLAVEHLASFLWRRTGGGCMSAASIDTVDTLGAHARTAAPGIEARGYTAPIETWKSELFGNMDTPLRAGKFI